MNNHAAEHGAVRVEDKAETSTVAVVGADLAGSPASICNVDMYVRQRRQKSNGSQ